MIPRLLDQNATTFDGNGFGLLTDTITATVTEQLNGDYYLEMQISVTDPNFQNIQIGSIIAVNPNKSDPRQAFVVEHISKPIEGICDIYATHIAQYRAKLIPVRAFTATSLANALSLMKSRSLETNPFTITTDKTNTTPMANLIPHTFRELMGGVQGSLLDTYGGEFEYDNLNIQLLNRRGRKITDIRILYGRNMTEFQQDEDFSWTDSLTGVVPYWLGADGTTVVGSAQYSANKSLYPYAKTGILDCTQFFAEQPTAAQLSTYAASWISGKGLPAINMQVAFDQLQNADVVQIGDTVTITNSMYNVSTTSRVIGYTYNVLREEYDSIEIGAKQASVNDAITGIVNSASSDQHVIAENVNYSNAISKITSRNVQGALDELSARHDVIAVSASGTSLSSYTTQGIYWFSANVTPTEIPEGVNGWLVVIPSTTGWVKQIWLRGGTTDTNDMNMWVRTSKGSTWSQWSRIYTSAEITAMLGSLFNVQTVTISSVTLVANGYADISSYKPSAPTGYTFLFAQVRTWSTNPSRAAFNVTDDGKYLLGTGGTTITNLQVAYYFQKATA